MIRRPPRSTLSSSSAASDVYKRQVQCTLLLEIGIAHVLAIGVHMSGLDLVLEVCAKNLVAKNANQLLVLNGKIRFNPAIQVARHQVGTPQVHFFTPAIPEIENPAVLQKTSNNADDANVVAHPVKSRPQATDTPHQ